MIITIVIVNYDGEIQFPLPHFCVAAADKTSYYSEAQRGIDHLTPYDFESPVHYPINPVSK